MRGIHLSVLLAILLLTGCAGARNPNDPLEPINRGIYRFNDTVDKTVFKPIAQGYSMVMPAFGQTMATNFFSNLGDINVTINDFLQFKIVQGLSDGTRFVINSTLGVFGLFDIASTGELKKHREDFGQTLGKWGIGNGPYLVLPILGPTTLRDGIGDYVDSFHDPVIQIDDMRTRNQVYVAEKVSARAELLDQEKVLEDAMIDSYQFIRDAYLLRRRSLVHDGDPPREKYDFGDESDNGVAPVTSETTTPVSPP